MPGSQVDSLPGRISLGMVLTGSTLYFTFLTVKLIQDFIQSPVLQACDALSDFLIILCFPLSVLTYCILMLYQLKYPTKGGLETLAMIILVWASAVPFIYFQFYHDSLSLYMFIFVIFFSMARLVGSILCPEAPGFKRACVQFAVSSSLPAFYAIAKISACRYAIVPAYVKYLRYSGLGSLFNTILQKSGSGFQIYQCLVQGVIIGAAINYSGVLLRAYASGKVPPAECEAWVW